MVKFLRFVGVYLASRLDGKSTGRSDKVLVRISAQFILDELTGTFGIMPGIRLYLAKGLQCFFGALSILFNDFDNLLEPV